MPDLPGRILLDTHVWIWTVSGETDRIAPAVVEQIRRGAARGRLLVSAISVWEVAMLQAKGRIGLALELEEWVRRGLSAPGVRLAELSPEVMVESTRLPGEVHGDPADRMLMATARRLGAALATRDGAILSYAGGGHLAVLDATP
jgi:PIN domain nuclease of toxin-antitoxin system